MNVDKAMNVTSVLLQIWKELFQREQIVDDVSFFALGGDSLLAIRLIGCIRRRMGVEIMMRMLFDSSTIVALADRLEHGGDLPPYSHIPLSHRRQKKYPVVPNCHESATGISASAVAARECQFAQEDTLNHAFAHEGE